MDFIRNILTRNTFRKVWWSANETVGDFGGTQGVAKAIADADHNVKVATAKFIGTDKTDDKAFNEAYDALMQHQYNRQILDNIYEY